MGTGFNGTYVLTIDQTSLDGMPATTGWSPRLGQVWCRQGDAVRLDGPQSTLLLGTSVGHDALRARVARAVQRRIEMPDQGAPERFASGDMPEAYVISDGVHEFTLIPIETRQANRSILWCPDGVPLAAHDYHIVGLPSEPIVKSCHTDFGGDVICFTAGTRIKTQDGHKLVETLGPGDHVQSKDNGCQEILWVGTRHMTGARLHAMPHLRPVRIKAHALQEGVPDGDLLVSPHHRMLYQGRNAEALFNTSEVLISASDMINDHSIFVDQSAREVTYVHLLFAEHQIVWANGVPTESFHPANTTLKTIEDRQRDRLLDLFPGLGQDVHHYGPHARRNLAKSEAAIILHDRV
ncbi:Hint domain-containing protein [Litoreibacter sp.]|nr:Hint domain-containing protein [Litoreibacter sp.]